MPRIWPPEGDRRAGAVAVLRDGAFPDAVPHAAADCVPFQHQGHCVRRVPGVLGHASSLRRRGDSSCDCRQTASARRHRMTLEQRADLVLAFARTLYVNGQATEQTVDAAGRLSRALGLRVNITLTPRWGDLQLVVDSENGNAGSSRRSCASQRRDGSRSADNAGHRKYRRGPPGVGRRWRKAR